MPDDLAVLKERVRYLDKEVTEVKEDAKEKNKELTRIGRSEDRITFRLKRIEDEVFSISEKVSKDTGWRGFLLDFIKAAAQIAALVGAGKFIF